MIVRYTISVLNSSILRVYPATVNAHVGRDRRRLLWPRPSMPMLVRDLPAHLASTPMLAGTVDAYVGPGRACTSRIDAYVGRATVDAYFVRATVDAYVGRDLASTPVLAGTCLRISHRRLCWPSTPMLRPRRSPAVCRGRRRASRGALAPTARSQGLAYVAERAVRRRGTADGLGSMWTGAVALAAGRMQWPYPRTGDPRVRG